MIHFGVLIAKTSMSISIDIIGNRVEGIVIKNKTCISCIHDNFGREYSFNFMFVLYPFIICNVSVSILNSIIFLNWSLTILDQEPNLQMLWIHLTSLKSGEQNSTLEVTPLVWKKNLKKNLFQSLLFIFSV